MEAPPLHEVEEVINPHIACVVLAAASICELIAASLVCGETSCNGLIGYAVSVGVVSLLLLAPVALVLFAEPLAPKQLPEGLPHLSLLLLLWWVPACFLLTFVGPFDGLSNAYFATLAGAAGALQLTRAHVAPVDAVLMELFSAARNAPSERPLLCGLALSSTAMWVEAAICTASYPGEHPAVKAWAIIVGVVSSVLCAFYLLLPNVSLHQHGFAALLAAWWCQGVAISFVPSSYIRTCNGFLSTWCSVFLAFYFLRETHGPRDLQPVPTAEDDSELPGFGGPTSVYISHGGGSGEGLARDPTEGFSADAGPSLRVGPPPTEGFRHTGSSVSSAQ